MKKYIAIDGQIAFYLNIDLLEKYYNLGYDIYEIDENNNRRKLSKQEIDEITGGTQ